MLCYAGTRLRSSVQNILNYHSIAYADDVTLVSPTRYGMPKMLDTCSLFAERVGYCLTARKMFVQFSVKIDFCHP